MSKRPRRYIDPTSIAIPPCAMGRTSGSAPLSRCPGRSGIAVILISPPELPIARSRTAGNWDMLTPLPTPSRMPAWPRSSPETSPPSAPTAMIAWRSRVNTASPYGRAWAGFSRAGPTPKGVKRRLELAASATVWPRPRRPAPATPLYLTLLVEALALAGKIEEALAALDDALAKAAVSGVRGWDAEIHRLRGELTGRLPHPDPAKAEDSFRTALAIAREQGTRGYELRAATSLARLWRGQGRRGEARDLLAPLYGWFTEGFDTADLKDAKRLLDELAATYPPRA